MEAAGANGKEERVLEALMSHPTNEAGEVGVSKTGYIMSAADIAEYLGLPTDDDSIKSNIRRALGGLVRKGILRRSRTEKRGNLKLTVYALSPVSNSTRATGPEVGAPVSDSARDPCQICTLPVSDSAHTPLCTPSNHPTRSQRSESDSSKSTSPESGTEEADYGELLVEMALAYSESRKENPNGPIS